VKAAIMAEYDLYRKWCPDGLRISHPGRVRISELKQVLRTGREREPFGILWDVRHWEQDLQVAILEASATAPLTVAYLDMNGLKQINDSHGHDAGDLALKAYFHAVSSAIGGQGEAYRIGGDEVLVVMPNCDAKRAGELLKIACAKLMSERLEEIGSPLFLSIAAGVISSRDSSTLPGKLQSSADKLQYAAKERSKKTTPRPSVIASDEMPAMIEIPHERAAS
jgi:diguanylate cyclase (GGDEF)-like protein